MKTTWLLALTATIITSAIVFHGVVEASNGPQAGFDRHGTNGYGPKPVSKTTNNSTTTDKGTTVLTKGTPPGLTGIAKSGILTVDSAKKVDAAKWLDKNGKSLVKNDLLCKPYCKPGCDPCWKKGWGWCTNWCGWGCLPYDNWCGGWFGGWCGSVNVEPIIVAPIMETPIVEIPDLNPAPSTDAVKVQTRRFLKLKNDSAEKLQVFVQYIVRTEDGEALWIPGEPETDKALTLTIEPCQELFVEINGKRIASSVVRIWAVSSKGQLQEFRGKDLWLVPEQAPNGDHVYIATEVKTFTFVFPRVDG